MEETPKWRIFKQISQIPEDAKALTYAQKQAYDTSSNPSFHPNQSDHISQEMDTIRMMQ